MKIDEKRGDRPGINLGALGRRPMLGSAAAGGVGGIGSSSRAVAELARSLSRPAPGSALDSLSQVSSAAAVLAEAVAPRQMGQPIRMSPGVADLARGLAQVARPTPQPGVASLSPTMGELMRKFVSPKGQPGWAAALTAVKSGSATPGVADGLAQRFAQIAGGSSMAGVADIDELTRRMVVPMPESMKMAGPGIGVAAKMWGDQRAGATLPGAAASLVTLAASPGAGGLVDSLRRLKGLTGVNPGAMQSLKRGAAPGPARLMTSTVIPKELSIVRWGGGAPGAGALARLCNLGAGCSADLIAGGSALASMQSVLSSLRSPLHESMRSWGVSEAVAGALRSLWPLADRGLKHARAALNAALGAWDALVRGAADAYERVVSLLNWLGFTVVSDDLVGSAMMVLADADRWRPVRLFSAADERGAVARLRRLVLIENRRVTRLSIDPDRRLRGYPLRSLDESVELDDAGTTVALRELVVERAAIGSDMVDEPVITHPGLAAVWSKLTDRERDLLLEKSSRPHTTWPAAAAAYGVSREEAERLRRKIKHLLSRGLAAPC